jgi:hypothetical protein
MKQYKQESELRVPVNNRELVGVTNDSSLSWEIHAKQPALELATTYL